MNTITINDLATIRNIIDLSCKRGAFGAAEIKEVSVIYEKIDTLIKSALSQVDQAVPTQNSQGV
jgi:hypothetical protein